MLDNKGILVGCDQNQEWLLSWWWDNLARVGNYPVTFADFGMSDKAKAWCQERGELFSLDTTASIDPLGPKLLKRSLSWRDNAYLTSRPAWFKKPVAMLNTSYTRTLWLDLDCEVLAPLEPLFDTDLEGATMGLVPEAERHQELPETLYNSGVILFETPSKLISLWAEEARSKSSQFRGDQELLSHLIFKHKFLVKELPAIYNWHMIEGVAMDACIIHWLGSWGKAFIRQENGFRAFLSKMQSS